MANLPGGDKIIPLFLVTTVFQYRSDLQKRDQEIARMVTVIEDLKLRLGETFKFTGMQLVCE